MLRDNWPVIDWREPIGLQERLEGRSSHKGEISVMSRDSSKGNRSDSTPPLLLISIGEGGQTLWRPLRTDTEEASRTDQETPEPWRGREFRRPWQVIFVTLASSFTSALLGEKLGLNSGT